MYSAFSKKGTIQGEHYSREDIMVLVKMKKMSHKLLMSKLIHIALILN